MPRLPLSRSSLILILLLAAILTLGVPASAQEVISLNETKIGQLTGAGPASYNFVSPPGLSVHIEIIAATQGLAPQFSIFNANNALVQTIGNPSLGLVVENTVTLPQAGVYRIEVSSASGAAGQFVIQLSSGTPPVPVIALALNVPVSSTLATNERATYSFNTNAQSGVVVEISTNGAAGLTATLSDASGTVVGMMGSMLTGVRFDVPPGQSPYRLEVANDGSLTGLGGYQVTLLTGAPGVPVSPPTPVQVITATPTQEPIIAPTATPGDGLPPLPETGACVLATASATVVNIRATTSTDSDVIGRMSPQNVYPVTGVNPDRTWYQIAFDGQTGWVAGFVVRTGGDCTLVRIVFPPPSPLPPIVETAIPISTPIPGARVLNDRCVRRYGNGSLIDMNNLNCYTCSSPYEAVGGQAVGSTLRCDAPQYAYATRHGRAGGFLGTDCPSGLGQFYDPNGYCYSCPPGYERTVFFAVTTSQACEHSGGASPAPVRLGTP